MAVEKQVNVIVSAVDQYSSVLTGLSGGFGKIALAAVAVEVAILAASVAAAKFAVDIGQDCFDSAVDFHDAIYNVEAVAASFGTTGEDIGEILRGLVSQFPITGKEGGDALTLIAQKGYGAKDQLDKISEAAMILSIATGTDMATAADLLITSMNALSAPIDDVDKIINTLAATSFTTGANINDLKESMKYAAADIKLLNLPLNESAVIMGIFRDNGLEASQAGTTFRMGMQKLIKPSTDGEAAIKKLGLSLKEVNPEFVGVSGVIEVFQGKTIGAKDAIDIFGTRSKAWLSVIQDGLPHFRKHVDMVTETTAAYDASRLKLQMWENVAKNVDGTLDAFKDTIAADLVPTLISFMGVGPNDGIRGIITQLDELEKVSGAIGQPMTDLFEELKDLADNLFKDAFGDVEGFYNYLADISNALSTNVEIISIWASALAEAFIDSTDDADKLETMLHLVNAAIAALATPVAVIHDLFVGFFYALNLGWDLAEGAFTGFAYLVTSSLVKIAEVIDMLPFIDMGDRIDVMSEKAAYWKIMMEGSFDTEAPELWMQKVGEVHAEGTQAVEKFAEEAKESYKKVEEATVNWGDKIIAAGDKYKEAKDKLNLIAEGGPELVGTTEEWIKAVAEAEDEYSKAETELKKVLAEAENLEAAHANAVVEVVNWKEKLGEVTDKYEEAKKKAEEGGDSTGNAAAEVVKWAVEVSKTTDKYEEAKKKAEETKVTTKTITDEALLWGKELIEVDKSTQAVAETSEKVVEKLSGASKAIKMATEEAIKWKEEVERLDVAYSLAQQAAEASGDSTGEAAVEAEKLGKELGAANLSWKEAKDRAEGMSKATKEVATAAKDAKNELSEIEKFELKLEAEKFKSDLKIAEEAVKAAASLIETKLEWAAKIDIAEIEAAADVAVASAATMQSAFDAVGQSVSSISSGLGTIVDVWASGLDTMDQWYLEDLIEEQTKMQQKLVESQIAMNEALIAESEAKAEALKKGDAEISVSVEGDMEGWLKGLMQSLFNEIMVKAKTESFSVFGTE